MKLGVEFSLDLDSYPIFIDDRVKVSKRALRKDVELFQKEIDGCCVMSDAFDEAAYNEKGEGIFIRKGICKGGQLELIIEDIEKGSVYLEIAPERGLYDIAKYMFLGRESHIRGWLYQYYGLDGKEALFPITSLSDGPCVIWCVDGKNGFIVMDRDKKTLMGFKTGFDARDYIGNHKEFFDKLEAYYIVQAY